MKPTPAESGIIIWSSSPMGWGPVADQRETVFSHMFATPEHRYLATNALGPGDEHGVHE